MPLPQANLTKSQNEFKIVLKELEDSLLARLSAASGNFLGDTTLVENLETTKHTASEIEEKVGSRLGGPHPCQSAGAAEEKPQPHRGPWGPGQGRGAWMPAWYRSCLPRGPGVVSEGAESFGRATGIARPLISLSTSPPLFKGHTCSIWRSPSQGLTWNCSWRPTPAP